MRTLASLVARSSRRGTITRLSFENFPQLPRRGNRPRSLRRYIVYGGRREGRTARVNSTIMLFARAAPARLALSLSHWRAHACEIIRGQPAARDDRARAHRHSASIYKYRTCTVAAIRSPVSSCPMRNRSVTTTAMYVHSSVQRR